MDASGGSREEKDDDHESNHRKRSFDILGFKNVEGSDKKSYDDVSQSSDQMEVVEDSPGRMFGNSDRVVENSNAEFMVSQMDISGSVGVVGGQFGNELLANRDMWNQRKWPQDQNTGSSSHGTVLGHENLLGQSTSGTQLMLHSESSDVLGQGQGTGGTGSALLSECSSRNVHGQGQQGTHTCQRGRFRVTTYEQPSANPGFFAPRDNMRGQSHPNIVGQNVARLREPAVQLGSDTHTCQRGRFRVTTYAEPSANPDFFASRAVQEHNMRVPSNANMVHADIFRQGTPQMGQQRGFFGTPRNPFFPTCASQNAGLPVARPPVHMGMSSNADMAVEAGDGEEVVSDQGSTSEDS